MLEKKPNPSFRVWYTSTRRVFWQGHGQSVLQHGHALHISFHCSGLFFLLMKCEVCVKLSVSVWLPQRGWGVMRAWLWPCGITQWRCPYGVGRGRLKGGSQQMFDSILVAKSFNCQLAPVR